MLISCPKCDTQYDIDDTILSKKTKKMRCATCEEVFSIGEEENPSPVIDPLFVTENPVILEPDPVMELPEPAIESSEQEPEPKPVFEAPSPEPDLQKESKPLERAEPNFDQKPSFETEQNAEDNMQEIFARLSLENEKIEQTNIKASTPRKIALFIRKFLGLHGFRNRIIVGVLLSLILILYLFYAKYSIVRMFPAAEKAYSFFGIESVIVGEGLDFQNVTRNTYEDDYIRKMEIKGFIVNTTNRKIIIPTILVDLLDENASTLQTVKGRPNSTEVGPLDRVSFNVIIPKPAPMTKYILLTFTREK